MAISHWANAHFAHAWGFGTPGPFRVRGSARGLSGAKQATRVSVSNSRACAGKTDGEDALRVGLQISLNVGEGQTPKFLEWLAAELVKDS